MNNEKRTYNKNNPTLRVALWKAYEERDVYSRELIAFRELSVDHVVPERVFKDADLKAEVFENLELDETFELNSLENLVPTTPGENSIKSGSLDYSVISATLSKARAKKDKILKLIMKYESEVDIIEAAERIANSAGEEDKYLAADIIFAEEADFKPSEDLNKEEGYFSKCLNRVAMNACLPSIKEMQPTVTFFFRSLKARNCTIEVSHIEIMTSLFIGNNDIGDLALRPFITHHAEDEYIVHLGGCFIDLRKEEVEELCELIDSYQQIYFELLRDIEEKYSMPGLIMNSRGDIKLYVVDRQFCRCIFDFIEKARDYDRRWDIFEPNDIMIKVYNDKNTGELNRGYHAFMPAIDEGSDGFWKTDRKVGLYLKTYFDDRYAAISEKDWWAPSKARKWLKEELFPECVKVYKDYLVLKKVKCRDWVELSEYFYDDIYDNMHIGRIEVKNRLSVTELDACVDKLQSFFYSHKQRKIVFNEGSKAFFEAFKVLVNKGQKFASWEYIRGNLFAMAVGIEDSYKGVMDYISDKVNENAKEICYFDLDCLLRCFCECIHDGEIKLDAHDFETIWAGLDDLIKERNYHDMRERFTFS